MSTPSDLDLERSRQALAILRAALERPPAERAAFLDALRADDAAPRAEVLELLAALGGDEDDLLGAPPLAALAEAFAPAPGGVGVGDRVGPYQIDALVGEGGMGIVYRAHRADDAFQQQVALKVVRPEPGLPRAELARRLRRERQILASLQHPNIARLLDGGTTAAGLPYFAMEFVDGEPIDAYCDRHRLTVSDRLRLFATVCQAVQYAHQRLVVHRDLKPSNILVTPAGVPVLLDFGIATVLTPDAAHALRLTLSRAGQGPLTVAYASPEQISGEPLTTASDVYALGLVLYELLTGQTAHQLTGARPADVERIIREESPPPPSVAITRPRPRAATAPAPPTAEAVARTREGTPARLRRRLAGDLDQIVLMALRKEPARRYASAEHLAADIERHLTGRPVRAQTDTLGYRAGKFVRRHALPVVATALVLLSLVGGLMATLWQARVAEARRQEALAQQQIAEAERALAERRFNEVRQLARGLLYDLHDEIVKVQGATAARQRLVTEARAYLDRLAGEVGDNRELLAELAESYTRVGHVQGGIGFPSLGDTEGALESYRRGLAVRERLVAGAPGDARARRDLSGSQFLIADMLVRTGDMPGALASHRQALALREALVAEHPDDPAVRLELAVSHTKVGEGLARTGDTGGSLAAYERARAIQEAVVAANATLDEARLDLSGTYERIGWALARAGDAAGGLASHRRSLEQREVLARARPDDIGRQRGLSSAYINVGHLLIQAGEMGASLASFQQARAIRERLAGDPNDARAQRDLDAVRATLGDLLAVTGDLGGAAAVQRETVASRERLAAADPKNREVRRDLAISQERLADVLWKVGDSRGALVSARQSLAGREALVAEEPRDTRAQHDLTRALNLLGDLLTRTGDAPGALASHGRALAVQEALAANDAKDATARLGSALSRAGLADARLLLGETAAALADARQALTLREGLTAGDPANAEWQRDLSASYHQVGAALALSGDVAGSLAAHERGLAVRQKLADGFPADKRAGRELSLSLGLVGAARLRAGDVTGALTSHERALALQEALRADPADALVRAGLAASHEGIGEARLRQADAAGALARLHLAQGIRALLLAADPANALLRRDQAEGERKLAAARAAVAGLGQAVHPALTSGQGRRPMSRNGRGDEATGSVQGRDHGSWGAPARGMAV